ncbi:hypothetical protein ABZS66_48645, partial [Dactylosporangium sp. NPDC005572]|uniref:hypothetical protein n=1 Tax=Dactylosporangium sp. NPDC005572 TaxID=3156889 RepID=UPI0033B8E9D1
MATIGEITRELVATGRGILVADDYPPAFRDLVVATPGLEAAVAGVVVPVEAVRRAADRLRACGVLTGVTADTRLAPLAGCPGESVA